MKILYFNFRFFDSLNEFIEKYVKREDVVKIRFKKNYHDLNEIFFWGEEDDEMKKFAEQLRAKEYR